MSNTPLSAGALLAPNGPALPLLLDFLAWLAPAPRPYAEVMETWRTSCPRLTVWEDAVDLGLVARQGRAPEAPVVTLTPRGRLALQRSQTA